MTGKITKHSEDRFLAKKKEPKEKKPLLVSIDEKSEKKDNEAKDKEANVELESEPVPTDERVNAVTFHLIFSDKKSVGMIYFV
jgi:hypothetical protein